MSIMTSTTGIEGLFGDGAGGNAALSIAEKTLQILYNDSDFTFKYAVIEDLDGIKAGRVYYRKPQILQVRDYGDGRTNPQIGQVTETYIDIDKRALCEYELEPFNTSRMALGEQLLSQMAASFALSIKKTLDAAVLNMWKFHTLAQAANNGVTPKAKDQFIKVKYLGKPVPPAGTPLNEVAYLYKNEIQAIRAKYTQLGKTYSKETMGINVKGESMFGIVAPEFDLSIANAGNTLLDSPNPWFLADTHVGTKLGDFKYIEANLLNQDIPRGSSFNWNFDSNLKGVLGFIVHNQATACPMSIKNIFSWRSEGTLRPMIRCEFQWGMGILREQLVYAIIEDGAEIDTNDFWTTGSKTEVKVTFDNTKVGKDGKFSITPNTVQTMIYETTQQNATDIPTRSFKEPEKGKR